MEVLQNIIPGLHGQLILVVSDGAPFSELPSDRNLAAFLNVRFSGIILTRSHMLRQRPSSKEPFNGFISSSVNLTHHCPSDLCFLFVISCLSVSSFLVTEF